MSGPIFIIGPHRSGTTWLNQLMVETGCFDYLTAFHVIKYNVLPSDGSDPATSPEYAGVASAFERLELTDRKIDDVQISPLGLEEYGFVLDNAGTGLRITGKNVSIMNELCRKIGQGKGRPVLLKNPWDSANFLEIKRCIPQARFVFIHRHPERIIHSNLNATRLISRSKHAYLALLWRRYDALFTGSPRQRLILGCMHLVESGVLDIDVRLSVALLARVCNYFCSNVSRLPAGDYVSLRYEDLCANPAECLGDVLEFAGIERSKARQIQTVAKNRATELSSKVVRHRNVIARKMSGYMKLHGYEPGGIVR